MSESELISQSLFERLSQLSRLFVWHRKKIHNTLEKDLLDASERHASLYSQHQKNLAQLQHLIIEQQHLNKQIHETESSLDSERSIRKSLAAEYSKLKTKHQKDLVQLQNLIIEQQHLNERIHETESSLDSERSIRKSLAAEYSILKNQHNDTYTRLEFVSKLLAARPATNEGLAHFKQLLEIDYMAFAEAESSLPAEAKALTILQTIERELALLISFPDISKRTVVGIVGGFSSGKSEFINSFILDQDIRLTVGIQPVTAIPTYVLSTEEPTIRGYSNKGGYSEMNVEFYGNISHSFINSFGFDLKGLMPFMCVGTRMDPKYFSNICLIDTPGYNPPATASEYSGDDKITAVQFAQQANAIIWLIGLDANGTVPDSDLDFIHEIGCESKSIYVVLNKADLKSDDDIESIIDEVQSTLDFEGVNIHGICAYSSIQSRVIAFRGQELMEHFAEINKPGNVPQQMFERVDEVFSMYEKAIQEDIIRINRLNRSINSLKLDVMEIGGETLYRKMQKTIDSLETECNTKQLENWLKQSRDLSEKFTEAIQEAMAAIGWITQPNRRNILDRYIHLKNLFKL